MSIVERLEHMDTVNKMIEAFVERQYIERDLPDGSIHCTVKRIARTTAP